MVSEKFSRLRMLLENNPDGISLKRVAEETSLAYPTIKKKLEEWGFVMRKEEVLIKKKIYVIVKKKEIPA